MTADATREEAIQWCVDNGADFISPIFPPPEGWAWGQEADRLVLTAIFTNTEDADIEKSDIAFSKFKSMLDPSHPLLME